jgi:L-threonylcarbamoyladenylate synthase
MPAHPVALELIRLVGEPVAAPSANLFSRTSPTTAAHVLQDLTGRIDAVLDGGPTSVGVESTVVDLRGEAPVILRPGGVSRAELERVLGRPVPARGGTNANPGTTEPLAAPGLLLKHYSPRAEVFLYDGPIVSVAAAMRQWAEAAADPPRTALLAFTEDLPLLAGAPVLLIDLGSRTQPDVTARRLYAALRDLDARGITQIALRLAPPGGLGDAINDRLRRAASGRLLVISG